MKTAKSNCFLTS